MNVLFLAPAKYRIRRHPSYILALLLAGCSHTSPQVSPLNYEAKLKLQPLPTPEAVLVATNTASKDLLQDLSSAGAALQNAKTMVMTNDATLRLSEQLNISIEMNDVVERLETQMNSAKGLGKSASLLTKKASGWLKRSLAFYKRASEIKKAQLKAGDIRDSTGEVARYIKCGHQSYENWCELGRLRRESDPNKA